MKIMHIIICHKLIGTFDLFFLLTNSWSFPFLHYFLLHKPASYGTPVAGSHEFPAKKLPTVNFPASVGLVIT